MKLLLALVITSGIVRASADAVPGLGVLCPEQAELTVGETAARQLGIDAFSGEPIVVVAGETLVIPAGLRVLWWHSETTPIGAAMIDAKTQSVLRDWVAAGHGLLLTGTALTYVTTLGLEPANPRLLGAPQGPDGVVAQVSPARSPEHPIYRGLDTRTSIPLASDGFPPSADFHGSGGPLGGVVIGDAVADAGESPLVEYACGEGRVIVMGWRLPFYGLENNAYAANLHALTEGMLAYLAGGDWAMVITDARSRAMVSQLQRIDAEAVRLAVEDLRATFGERYAAGDAALDALDSIPGITDAIANGEEGAIDRAEATTETVRAAMLANPLLDFDSLLLVRRSEPNLALPQNWESNSTLPTSGIDNELCALSPVSPDGELRTVYKPEGGRFVGDVDLHFDADRVLFSMPDESRRWGVYEMALDGGAPELLPLISEPDVQNYDACYLPSDDILFTSTAPFVGVPCVTGSSHVATLYRLDRATGGIRQLTFEQDHDWCPTPLPDGRVLYLRWEYADIPHFISRILFTMRPDGTEQRAYYGSNSYWPNAMFYARSLPGDSTRFVAVVGGHHDNPRMGELVLFDTNNGQREADGVIQRIPGRGKPVEPIILDGLTQSSWPKFLHPYPLSDKYFITSCKPSPGDPWGIYLVDVFDNLTLIKELPGNALLEPLPIVPRARPPVLPPSVDPERDDGFVYLADIYSGPGLTGVPRGAVKKLRLLTYHFAYHGMGGQVNRVGLDGPWDIKRVMGTVPVAEDGSAYFRVPANTPISIQPLDERGQALQLMRSWMVAMPGETVSCIGCHERNNDTPPSLGGLAFAEPASEITPWYGPERGFSFDREVQPVLDRYCIGCHDGVTEPLDLTAREHVHPAAGDEAYRMGTHFSPSYLALRSYVRGHTIESDAHMLPPGEFAADTTHLIQLLDKGHYGVDLDAEAWDRLITWIDLNTPAHGTWHEIVGENLVAQTSGRRSAMLERYANRRGDPEAVYVTSVAGTAPVVPAALAPQGEAPVCESWPLGPQEATALQVAAGDAERTIDLGDGLTLALRRVPAGRFIMGDRLGSADEQSRVVTIDEPFWMGALEISNAQYSLFDPSHDSRLEHGDFLQFSIQERGYPLNAPDQPVCRVSWTDATRFCEWLSERTGLEVSVPTEAQWEWACRAGSDAPMQLGGLEDDTAPFANLADASLRHEDTFAPWGLPSGAIHEWRIVNPAVNDGYRVSAPVGSFGANAWGLHDMCGNVAEWTTGQGEFQAVRGGSWYDTANRARSAARSVYPTYRPVFDVGFRVAARINGNG